MVRAIRKQALMIKISKTIDRELKLKKKKKFLGPDQRLMVQKGLLDCHDDWEKVDLSVFSGDQEE